MNRADVTRPFCPDDAAHATFSFRQLSAATFPRSGSCSRENGDGCTVDGDVLDAAVACRRNVSPSITGESPGPEASWLELTRSECFELLAGECLRRVAFVDDRGPMVVPVNYVVDRHMVVVRTDEGAKLDAAIRCARVAFEVDRTNEADHTGWSVVIRGEAVEVTDPYEVARLRELPLQPWAPGDKTHYVRILPATLSGRRISAEGRDSDRGDRPPPGGAAPDRGR